MRDCYTGGTLSDAEPMNKTQWLDAVTKVSGMADLGVLLVWGLKAGFLSELENRAGPSQATSQPRGSLFPLPVTLPQLDGWRDAGDDPCGRLEVASNCWVALGCVALNALYGLPGQGKQRSQGKVHVAALGDLKNKIRRFLDGETPVSFSFNDVATELKERRISYSGEEIQQPHPLTCEQIVKGLPPEGHGGSISVLPFLHGRTKYYMEHPLESLLAEKDRASAPVSARVHIAKGCEKSVFCLLQQRGIISWIEDESVFKDSRGQYLSGMFGVAEEATPEKSWWQVYLDNFMAAELSPPLHERDVTLQEQAMHAWSSAGILTAADKQVLGSTSATELGVRIDGKRGLLGGSPERVFKTVWATFSLLSKTHWSKKEVQIILGRWVFLLQYRRAAMGMLSRSWQALESHWLGPKQIQIIKAELLGLIFLSPLLQADLTSDYDNQVTCSDASEHGGACAVASTLSWSGRSLVGMKNDLRLQPLEFPLLIVSIFNGVGGPFRVYDILGIRPAGRISVDISPTGNRVTRSAWPDVLELHDVEHIDREEILRWARLFPHIKELHLFAGFPCIHLSSVRAYRQNLEGEGLAPGASVHPSVDVPITRLLSYGDRRGAIGDGRRAAACPCSLTREPDRLCKSVVMPRNLPRVVLAARTRQGRQEQRRGIRLRDYTVTTRTKERYERAVGRILPFLEAQPDLADLDGIVCDYIELQWCRGETVNDIADCLSGLHFFWPHIKGLLRQSWRLFRSWRRVESPQRAPPITVWLVKAIVARAVDCNQLAFATLVALGFHCLLRTGELLALQFKDFECNDSCGVVSLFSSKSGLRTGAEEAVSIRDPLVLNLIRTLSDTQQQFRGQKLWPHSAQSFRNQFEKYMQYFRICHLKMKPYSLRRGGATFLLQEGVSIDVILLRGRWRSLGVARLYLEDGLSQIPKLRMSSLDRERVGDCPPGKVHEWQIEAEHRHEHLLREVMKPVRIMAFHERSAEDPAVKATQQFIARARSSPEAALSEFYCTHVSREDICFVRAHAALDVSIMAMAKNLMTAMADFLKTANQGDVAVPVFLPQLGHVQPIAQELRLDAVEEEDAPQPESPKEDKLMLRSQGLVVPEATGGLISDGQRPASAPARPRVAGHVHDRASLESAISREKLAQRNWVVTSQKHLASRSQWMGIAAPGCTPQQQGATESEQSSQELQKLQKMGERDATMRSCLYRVKDLNPPMTPAMQHQANIQILPSDLREWTLAAEKVFEVREAAIAKAKREEEERMELLAFRPKTMENTDGSEDGSDGGWLGEPAAPEVDSLASEVQEPVRAKSTLSTDDFLMDVDWRQGSRSPKVRSNVGSKLSFMAKLEEAPPIPQSEDGSFHSSPREVPTSDRQPESPTATDGGISTRPDSALSGAVTRPASATQRRPLSGKRPKRPGSAAGSTRPPSGTGLRDLFSSKLSRLARPTSALSRSSSATKLSLEPAQGATSPTSAGNLTSPKVSGVQPAPVKVRINHGQLGVFVVISDEAGGIADINDVWRWGEDPEIVMQDAEDSEDEWEDPEALMAKAQIAKATMRLPLGFGLPLARLTARYFGGDLRLQTLLGHGTNAYIHIPELQHDGHFGVSDGDRLGALKLEKNRAAQVERVFQNHRKQNLEWNLTTTASGLST
eukprot:s393_g22.t1